MLIATAMAIPRPFQQIDWSSTPDITHPRAEPIPADKTAGFLPGGRVRCDYANWLLYSIDQWNDWFDTWIIDNGAA